MSGDLWGPCTDCGRYWEDYVVPTQDLCPHCERAGGYTGRLRPIPGANLDLVRIVYVKGIGPSPHCRLHGAMNKLTKDGIWRCMATYRIEHVPGGPPQGRVIENNCLAGCVVMSEGDTPFGFNIAHSGDYPHQEGR